MTKNPLLLILLLASPLISGISEARESQPNIVMIVMDNLGWGELGVYGGGILRGAETPNLDQLAAEGMRLLNFNVESQCTPSRSALMTGRHPIRSGTTRVVWGQLYGMTQWEYTIAEALSDEGYATAMYGKWHLGDSQGRFPTDQGFDEFWGIPNTTDEAVYSEGLQFDPESVSPPYIYESVKGKKPKRVKLYDRAARRLIDAELADHTIRFMERKVKEKKPFFVYLPYTLVHVPALPHPDFEGITGNGQWADVLTEVDHRSGQIIDALDRLGVSDNTIVIFMSENGPEQVYPYNGTAGPWRGTYFTALEGSLRTPFIVRWPGKIKAGAVNNEIVHITDVYPTLANIVGATVPTDRVIDGVDQSALLTGQSKESAREGFPVYNGDQLQAYKWRNWKMHFLTQDKMLEDINRPGMMPVVYNLLSDPKEEYNIYRYGARHGEDSMWVTPAVMKLVVQHKQTLVDEPPIKLGTPDPYQPGGKGK
jgi:arylsulfatase A-like enzyme